MVAGAEKACVCVLQYLTVLCCAVLCCAVVRAGENRTEQSKQESATTYLIKSIQKRNPQAFFV